jgi:hypothetical protein
MAEQTQTVNNLTDILDKVLRKLSEAPQYNRRMREILEDLENMAEDLKILVNESFAFDFQFRGFMVEIEGGESAKIRAPYSGRVIGYVGEKCLKGKNIYECLKERFSDRISLIEKLLEEFAEELDEYVKTIKQILVEDEDEEDP